MTVASAPCQLTVTVLLLAMPGLAWSMTLRGMQHPLPEPIAHQLPHQQPTAPKEKPFTPEKVSDNVMLYDPKPAKPADPLLVPAWEQAVAPAVGSLILLMGYGADLSWTLTQWWYLHPEWALKDQKWCKKDGYNADCWFDEGDKAAAKHLTSNLRIVDAVGKIVLCKNMHAWYKYTVWPDGPPIPNEFEVAIANVFELIEQEYKIVGDYKRIAVAGMSQGADLSLEVGIRFPHQLGMVISQRGVLTQPRKQGNLTLAPSVRSGTPFILTAGDADELSSLAMYKESCASMQLMQSPVYFKSFPGLNHGDFSKPEWKLLIDAFTLMVTPDHQGPQLAHLTTWDSCAA